MKHPFALELHVVFQSLQLISASQSLLEPDQSNTAKPYEKCCVDENAKQADA